MGDLFQLPKPISQRQKYMERRMQVKALQEHGGIRYWDEYLDHAARFATDEAWQVLLNELKRRKY